MVSSVQKESNKTSFFEVLKAIILSLVVCLILVLLSSFLLNLFELSDTVLVIINTAIKIVSILVGCLFSFKSKSDGWLKGISTGIFFIAFAYIIFSLLEGKFEADIGLAIDALCGAIAGLVSGIISVNIRK